MCNNFPNIRITEGNNFSLVLPLRSRTYVATEPIDEDIDPAQLENVVVTFGGVEYPAQITAQGVQIDLPATLAVGTYNILLTAEYLESSIRAAYESAVTIVPWSAQSTAEQYITGSPIVMRAAYVLSGALTDAELEALKQEYREKNAQLDQAIAEAEAAKEEWEEKAADLDGVAQEATSQEILNAVSGIGAISSELESGKTAIVSAIEAQGGEASGEQSLGELAQDIGLLPVLDARTIFEDNIQRPIQISEIILKQGAGIKDLFDNVTTYTSSYANFSLRGVSNSVTLTELVRNDGGLFYQSGFKEIYLPKLQTSTGNFVRDNGNLCILYIPSYVGALLGGGFFGCVSLIDLTIGDFLQNNIDLVYAAGNIFTQAVRTDTNRLCFDDDEERYGRTFSNNWEKWKWCVINHFASRLQDRTGQTAYTITYGSILSHFDAEMIAAFTDKNWNLA